LIFVSKFFYEPGNVATIKLLLRRTLLHSLILFGFFMSCELSVVSKEFD